ncbi:pseudouridine synthase [Pontibacter sp. KCTC 32443]|uniref:pseudouridine synthase n=1 Tax=Pontibacter TaxID=323449 RepID=UPI00164D99FA|nr:MULTISPECIES: pseudouridine synthase [Pontibacter]MBC5774838.1 pseudouridine synthase [Pontibacter sp. KCTC 32443]
MEPKRLNKFISDTGFCSRRDADRLIEEERVTVNGKLPAPGTMVTAKDKVRIDDQILRVREELPVFLVFNKPSGMSAKSDPSVRDNVVRAINYPATLEPIGYLDRDSEGVMFLSNDTELVRRMTKSDNRYEKEFIVTVDKIISQDFIAKLIGGGENEKGEKLQKTFISKEGSTRFRIVLTPGSNHNIKMLCENLGYKVVHLQRIRIENFSLVKLPTGHWRALTAGEVEGLRSIATGKATIEENTRSRGSNYTSERAGKKDSAKTTGGANKISKAGSTPRIGKSKPKVSGPKKGGAASTKGARGSSRTTTTRTTPGRSSSPQSGERKGPSGPKRDR